LLKAVGDREDNGLSHQIKGAAAEDANRHEPGARLIDCRDFKIYTNDYLRHVMVSQEKGACGLGRVNPISLTGPSIIMRPASPSNAVRSLSSGT